MASGVVLRPDGRLVATPDAIAKLKRLCEEDAAALQLEEPERHPPSQLGSLRASDGDIEANLAALMTEVAFEAKRCFALAREAVVPGGEVEARSVHLDYGTRLCRAYAEMTVALSRHRGRSQRLILEHFVHRGV
jgi:hypothetical protein